jgi:hypothetical protein
MAIIHRAELRPGKLELITDWLDTQSWGGSGPVTAVGAYRFDDPTGEVGVEGHLVNRGGVHLHVPLTYRGAPLDDPAAQLVGRMQHSVLGERFVYDATTDPVAVACLTRALRGEQQPSVWEIHDQGRVVGQRDPSVELALRSDPGDRDDSGPVGCVVVPVADAAELRIVRVLGVDEPHGRTRLVATWDDGSGVVAGLS